MRQLKTIEKLKEIIPNIQGIEIALLYGSFGRGEGNPNSDIDIQILVNEQFQPNNLINILKNKFEKEIKLIKEIKLRRKIVAYFNSQPKLEFEICRELNEINRNYLGSEISDVEKTILFTNEKWKNRIGNYLREITEKQKHTKTTESTEKTVWELIDKFIYEFESCSTMHRRSDAYQFYFFYNIALHHAVQLKHLSTGEIKYNFLPKNFVIKTFVDKVKEQDEFYKLKGTLYLLEANTQKRKLLNFFYTSIETLVNNEKQIEVKQFLEWIFERDYFWNFRDISTHNPRIKSGIIYRSATMSIFQDDNRFDELLTNKRIKTIIDLRADKEINELPYNESTLSKIKYIKAQLDPWNQPDWFKEKYHYGTDAEIAYRFFVLGCKEKLKTALEVIINEENATLIHCYGGKDRTGIFITLLHLLVDAPKDIIYADYLASESNADSKLLEIVLEIIQEKGGIKPYLIECGLSEKQIEYLKKRLINED